MSKADQLTKALTPMAAEGNPFALNLLRRLDAADDREAEAEQIIAALGVLFRAIAAAGKALFDGVMGFCTELAQAITGARKLKGTIRLGQFTALGDVHIGELPIRGGRVEINGRFEIGPLELTPSGQRLIDRILDEVASQSTQVGRRVASQQG